VGLFSRRIPRRRVRSAQRSGTQSVPPRKTVNTSFEENKPVQRVSVFSVEEKRSDFGLTASPSETVRKMGRIGFSSAALSSARFSHDSRFFPKEVESRAPPFYVHPGCLYGCEFPFCAFWLESLGKSAAAIESSDIQRRQKATSGFFHVPHALCVDGVVGPIGRDDKYRTETEHHLSLMRAR